jgi:hypothetical protein
MKSATVPAELRYLGAAMAFAACGALSAALFLRFPDWPEHQGPVGGLVFPLPFALLCTLSFMRARRALLIVPAMVLAWLAANAVAAQIYGSYGVTRPYLVACMGGVVGGFIVTLSASIGRLRLLWPQYPIAGCAIGGLSAVPIAFYLQSFPPHPLHLYLALASWQAAMGTYLYAIWINEAR